MKLFKNSFRKYINNYVKNNLTKRSIQTVANGEETAQSVQINWEDAKKFEEIPGPKPLPIIGNFFRFLPPNGEYYGMEHIDFIKYNKDKYGRIVRLSGIIGMPDKILIFHPEDVETLHRNEGVWPIRNSAETLKYCRTVVRKDVFQNVAGLSATHGKDWYNIRKVVNPILMQPRVVDQYIVDLEEVAAQFVENIRLFSLENKDGEMPEHFLNEIYKWALESVGVLALDKHFGCLKRNLNANCEAQQLIDCSTDLFKLSAKLDLMPSVWKIVSTPLWREFVQKFDYLIFTILKYIDAAIAKREWERKEENKMSVFEKLIKKDKQIAIATVADMFLAGIDTTGKALASALYFLAKNRDKQEILRTELRKYLTEKNTPITGAMLANCPYLKAVIKETLRKAPVAIGNARTTINDIVLAGYQIPKDTEVIPILIFASNDEQFYKSANQFLPERWLRSTDSDLSYKNAHPFSYAPFGFGPRACIGKRLANLELEIVLAKIIRNFDLYWPHPDIKFGMEVLYGVAEPLKLHIKPLGD